MNEIILALSIVLLIFLSVIVLDFSWKIGEELARLKNIIDELDKALKDAECGSW